MERLSCRKFIKISNVADLSESFYLRVFGRMGVFTFSKSPIPLLLCGSEFKDWGGNAGWTLRYVFGGLNAA